METIRPIAKKSSSFTRCNSEKSRKIVLQPIETTITNNSIDEQRQKNININKSNESLNRPLSQVNLDASSLNSSLSSQSSCDSSTQFTMFDPNQILNTRQIDLKGNKRIDICNNTVNESVDHGNSTCGPKPPLKIGTSDRLVIKCIQPKGYISIQNKLADNAQKLFDTRNKENDYNFGITTYANVETNQNNAFRSSPNLGTTECDLNEIQEINCLLADDMTFLVSTPQIKKLYPHTPSTIDAHRRHMQRFKLIVEGDLQICKLQKSNNMFAKFLNSKLLRRWKTLRIVLTDTEIISTSKADIFNSSIPYHTILELSPILKWEPGQKYCLRIVTTGGIFLLQKHKFKSERILRNANRIEILIKEINNMIDMSLTMPLDDTEIYQFPLELISDILQKHKLPKQVHEDVIISLSPLLEKNHPSPQICDFFSKHCRDCPRSNIVLDTFSPVVTRILKHNGDFGRHPRMRLFIQDYLIALMSQNSGLEAVQQFVIQMHSTSIQCPFPRVLPNFVSVCLASIHGCFESHRLKKSQQPIIPLSKKEQEDQLICHSTMLHTMSLQEDWRTHLSQLLQSVPVPDQALRDEEFIKIFKNVVKNFAQDPRCEVHQTLLGIREGKEGWFEIFCPGGISCDDNGELFTIMLDTLINCCCKKKRFLLSINKLLPHLHILARRGIPCAVNTLCAMLDLDGLEDTENVPAVIETLQQTTFGLKMYAKVRERQIQLKELQQKGGPRKLTLPSRSTDEDLAKILLSGSFGNLECLSLAFTNVTSACAEYLIKLPSLRYLNLWSTKFGDQGLELISEHLQQLQVLNLCETSVTDKGLSCLASMKQLRKLNLNSTNLSALTFEGLKECLPALQECDIRYTDAW